MTRITTTSLSILIVLTSAILHLRQASCFDNTKLGGLIEDIVAEVDEIAARYQAPPSVRPPPKVGGVYYPIGYGADPTGHNDSSDAIQKALNDAFSQRGEEKRYLMSPMKDLGGAVIDLQGGSYLISKPITFPPTAGNIMMKEGSLRASQDFPPNRYLVELMSPESEILIYKTESVHRLHGRRIYYEDVTFRDILFDSARRGGGLLVVNSLRTRIINSYFLNFTTQGILVQGGHETYISSCFLGQKSTVGDDEHEADFFGTAIDLASNDNSVTDTVLFSSQTGLLLRGQANMVSGLHVYNKGVKYRGTGIYVKESAAFNRIDNSYMDYTSIVIEDPYFIHLTNSMFLGDGNVVLKSVYGRMAGLTVRDNFFHGFKRAIVEVEGEFKVVDQVVVDGNQANKAMPVRSTVGRLTVAGNGTKWVADFNDQLVFPDKIDHFHYSFYVKGRGRGGRLPVHAATNVSGNVVVVESDEAVDAVLSVVVDQFKKVREATY
ncbi:unnamed protein product [Linum trigynum]|uniref:Pectate lyase superfamily protein domain-containing protein n=1 Tax=Linum trigynum TaxID=586398 RepID=A0AAV2FVW8_9ROSI